MLISKTKTKTNDKNGKEPQEQQKQCSAMLYFVLRNTYSEMIALVGDMSFPSLTFIFILSHCWYVIQAGLLDRQAKAMASAGAPPEELRQRASSYQWEKSICCAQLFNVSRITEVLKYYSRCKGLRRPLPLLGHFSRWKFRLKFRLKTKPCEHCSWATRRR